jgi:hypothetical protein
MGTNEAKNLIKLTYVNPDLIGGLQTVSMFALGLYLHVIPVIVTISRPVYAFHITWVLVYFFTVAVMFAASFLPFPLIPHSRPKEPHQHILPNVSHAISQHLLILPYHIKVKPTRTLNIQRHVQIHHNSHLSQIR